MERVGTYIVNWEQVLDRLAWLIDYRGRFMFGTSGQHHIDLGWAGDEAATGDLIFMKSGEIILRLLSYDVNYDQNSILQRVDEELARQGIEPTKTVLDLLPDPYSSFDPRVAVEQVPGVDGPVYQDAELRQNKSGVAPDGCFGYVDGKLYIGDRHHMGIMSYLINNGMDWNQLMEAPQAWGWIGYSPVYNNPESPINRWGTGPNGEAVSYNRIGWQPYINFATDAARIDENVMKEAVGAIQRHFAPIQFKIGDHVDQPSTYGEEFEQNYGEDGEYPEDTSVRPISKWLLPKWQAVRYTTSMANWWENPDVADWQHGLCDTYAFALCDMYPHLRLGTLDGGMHFFAHDDNYAYDSLGRHPLPYQGIEGNMEPELNQSPDDWRTENWPWGENGSPEDYERAKSLIPKQHPYLNV